jgi:hypothetical protein
VPEGGFLHDSDLEYEGGGLHFDGDDSNQPNVIERDIQGLRDNKLTMAVN